MICSQASQNWNLHSGYFLQCSAGLQCSVTVSKKWLLFPNQCSSIYTRAHSKQWFRYSAAFVSLNVARHCGHCNSDMPGCSFQAEFGVAAAAAGCWCCWCCCRLSAVVLNRGSDVSLLRFEEILCPMCTWHKGTTSLLSLLAPCWRQGGTYTVSTSYTYWTVVTSKRKSVLLSRHSCT